MKIKKPKIYAGAIAFLLILCYREYKESKIKEQTKTGQMIEQMEENIDFDSLFVPVDSEKSSGK